jgi:NAD dependent epimerase/dehydratase family enzyme
MNPLFERGLTDATMSGTYVATAPLSNAEFMRELKVPIGLPAFAWTVRLGALLLMRTHPELALYGRYCVPSRLTDEGFTFEFPTLPEALRDLLR